MNYTNPNIDTSFSDATIGIGGSIASYIINLPSIILLGIIIISLLGLVIILG